MLELLRYDNRRVVVVGCASGMGEATARLLVDLGAEVVGLDVRETAVPVARFVHADLTEQWSLDTAAESVDGQIDRLFNCAGLATTAPDLAVMLVNFVGIRHLSERLIPRMSAGGAIASIASTGGLGFAQNLATVKELLAIGQFDDARAWCEANLGRVGTTAYGFSKQCLTAYTLQRSYSLASQGIRMNVLSPGPTDTPMMPEFVKALGRKFMEEVLPRPLGRNATPDEQAHALIFLNSDAASYITGHNLVADGGAAGATIVGEVQHDFSTRHGSGASEEA